MFRSTNSSWTPTLSVEEGRTCKLPRPSQAITVNHAALQCCTAAKLQWISDAICLLMMVQDVAAPI